MWRLGRQTTRHHVHLLPVSAGRASNEDHHAHVPCDLINFYIPNRVPWVLTHSELDAFSNVSINAFAARSRSMIGKELVDQDLNELYPQQVIYLKTNQDYYWRLQKNPFYRDVIRSWTGLADKKSRFQWAWKDLMRPSPRLLAQLERVLGVGVSSAEETSGPEQRLQSPVYE